MERGRPTGAPDLRRRHRPGNPGGDLPRLFRPFERLGAEHRGRGHRPRPRSLPRPRRGDGRSVLGRERDRHRDPLRGRAGRRRGRRRRRPARALRPRLAARDRRPGARPRALHRGQPVEPEAGRADLRPPPRHRAADRRAGHPRPRARATAPPRPDPARRQPAGRVRREGADAPPPGSAHARHPGDCAERRRHQRAGQADDRGAARRPTWRSRSTFAPCSTPSRSIFAIVRRAARDVPRAERAPDPGGGRRGVQRRPARADARPRRLHRGHRRARLRAGPGAVPRAAGPTSSCSTSTCRPPTASRSCAGWRAIRRLARPSSS